MVRHRDLGRPNPCSIPVVDTNVRLLFYRAMQTPRLAWAYALGLSAALALAVAPAARAAQPIIASSGGPLTQIWLNHYLGCQADPRGHTSHQFFCRPHTPSRASSPSAP